MVFNNGLGKEQLTRSEGADRKVLVRASLFKERGPVRLWWLLIRVLATLLHSGLDTSQTVQRQSSSNYDASARVPLQGAKSELCSGIQKEACRCSKSLLPFLDAMARFLFWLFCPLLQVFAYRVQIAASIREGPAHMRRHEHPSYRLTIDVALGHISCVPLMSSGVRIRFNHTILQVAHADTHHMHTTWR